jgi:hypothetical protein
MTLIEAAKSGRPFKHKSWSGWYLTLDLDNECFRMSDGKAYGSMAPSYILSNDWEIQEPEVRITRTQFWEAYNAGLCAAEQKFHVGAPYIYTQADFIASELARRLGLEKP